MSDRRTIRQTLAARDGMLCRYCGRQLQHPDIVGHAPDLVREPATAPGGWCGCGKGERLPNGSWRCTGCENNEPDPGRYEAWASIDHVMPRSRGGGSSLDHLVLSCLPCNSAKGARTPAEWRNP